MTPQERIKADAEAKYPGRSMYILANRTGYIAGATAWAERAQVLVDALEAVRRKLNWIEDSEEREIIRKAIEQWKTGKEAQPCPHCGKELNRDRNLCCRECGKEVSNG